MTGESRGPNGGDQGAAGLVKADISDSGGIAAALSNRNMRSPVYNATDSDATTDNKESSSRVGGSPARDGEGPSTRYQGNNNDSNEDRRIYSKEDVEELVREAEGRGKEKAEIEMERLMREAETRAEVNAETKMKRKIQGIAECRICLKVPRADVMHQQCLNGHLTCETCMERCGDRCPTCRIPLNHGPRSKKKRIRALAIENIIEAVDLDRECKYEACEFAASKQILGRHEKICQQRPVNCPHWDCGSPVNFSDLLDHIRNDHEDTKFSTLSNASSYKRIFGTSAQNLEVDGGWIMDIKTYEGMKFIPQFQVTNGICYAWMYILGNCEEAEMFQVTMYIGEGQSAIAHHGKVFPVDIDCTDIIDQKSGVLSFSLALQGHNGMGAKHMMENQGSIVGSSEGSDVEGGANADSSRKISIKRCIQSLVHACQCLANCQQYQSCRKMKSIVAHTISCERKANGGCPICKQLIALCCYHAEACNEPKCPVPFCVTIKQKMPFQILNPVVSVPDKSIVNHMHGIEIVTVYFSITKSKEPHHLSGLHQFRQKGEGASASQEEDANEDEPSFSCKQLPIYRAALNLG